MTRARQIAASVALACSLSGCAMMQAPSGTISRERAMQSANWQSVATTADRRRLRDWWQAWAEGLASARAGGHGPAIDAEGALLDPQAALPGVSLAPGDYGCRIIKLGAARSGAFTYTAYPRFRCRITSEGSVLSLVKLTGSQRQSGLIFSDAAEPRRAVFLGTVALGDEQRAPDYGADAARDQAAWVERVGPAQWRLVFPRPAFESIVDVMELTPG